MTIEDKPVGIWFTLPVISLSPNEDKLVKISIASLDLAPGRYYFTFWIGEGDYLHYDRDFLLLIKFCKYKLHPEKADEAICLYGIQIAGEMLFLKI